MKTNEPYGGGGMAFPGPEGQIRTEVYSKGMSLRDWFAGRAMHGLVHDIIIDQPQEDALMKAGLKPAEFPGYLAHLAYVMADAMLAERAKSI